MASHRSSGYMDPGWDHGVAQDDKKKKVRCNYCGKVVSGGIYRLKQHLARLSGEVTYCDKAPDEVRLKMRENLEGRRVSKKSRHSEYEEQSYLNFSAADDLEEEEHFGYRKKGKQLLIDKDLAVNMTPLRSLGYVDPGWEHGVPQDERKKKVKCNYCEKIVSGGINRFKQHLARIPGEVAPCKNAPEEVYLKIKENMRWHRTGRRHRRPDTKEISTFYMESENEEEEQEDEAVYPMGNHRLIHGDRRFDRDFKRTSKGLSACNGSDLTPKRPRYDANVLKTPKTQPAVGGKLVKMGPSKRSRREVISAICKFFYHAGVPSQAANSSYFHKMLELVGQYGSDLIGPSSNMLSGRFLQDEILTVKNYLEEYKSSWAVTGCSVLADSWRNSQGRTLINILVSCPRGVYFVCSVDATGLVDDETYLYKLLDKVVEDMGEENVVQSNKWLSSRYSKLDEGKEVKNIVMDSSFWRKVQYVKRSVDPILEVLQKIDSDESLSMPFIYNDMNRAKLAIKINHSDDARKYESFWSVIDNHWDSLFHHPLYLAAYFLNPSYRYRPDFVLHPDVVRGLNACIVKLEPDSARRISASMQVKISDFGSAKADFGTDLAISTRSELDPAAWWQQHGINCLELQRIAVRILSQSCSSFGCEHNWSVHDQMHRHRQNRLSQKRLNEAIYVHYNLRLRERQMRKRSSKSTSLDSVLQEDLLYDWIVETEKQALQEDEEILYSEMEHGDGYENEVHDFDDGHGDSRKGSMDMVLADVAEPLDVDDSAQNDAASGDDQDLDFIEEDMTD
ncbi:hypothetical protein SASPL_101894 [Salvia splendens]|uniref:BED-type domain-containing protein n=1 Tax=Salvia splendens TaxID=180675 RepID=A0A8X8YUV2_SALSN|nr:hypothetical protein SASPL_101894 [Salvia splendens]